MVLGINTTNNPLHFYKPYDMLDLKSLEIHDSTDIDRVTDNVIKEVILFYYEFCCLVHVVNLIRQLYG